jgi:hypothetical protein
MFLMLKDTSNEKSRQENRLFLAWQQLGCLESLGSLKKQILRNNNPILQPEVPHNDLHWEAPLPSFGQCSS